MRGPDRIDRLNVAAYRIPTDAPESDGTAKWNHTDMVVVHAHCGDTIGIGWTYAAKAAGDVVRDLLSAHVIGQSTLDIEGNWQAMTRAVRNAGWPGVCATAISAVDIALWDLKAKLLSVSLVDLLGAVRESAPIYGSGGFTSYDDARLTEQFSGWAGEGITRMKMKVGRDAKQDLHRVAVARKAIGDSCELFVDANGAWSPKQAIGMAAKFAAQSNVTWFEEPCTSDDLRGLNLVRMQSPVGMDIAAGEYGYTPGYFYDMVAAGAVDCLQADATRCGGYTGFMKVAALCEAAHLPMSAHCGPQLHSHVACCAAAMRHVEYFHDHVRIESMLFEGALQARDGELRPDRRRVGHGLELNVKAAERFAV